jgi:threonyl-tRNA synthetase
MPERKLAREILAAAGPVDKDIVAVRFAGHTVDLHTPVEATAAELAPVRATDPAGLEVIRHSTAHVMADAVQRLFPGTKVTIGPAIDDGFYYDFDKQGDGFTDDDLRRIEATMAEIIAGDSPFRRVAVTREEAKKLFAEMGETYKLEIIDAIPESEEVTLYRHGTAPREWVDVCRGPHVPSTRFLAAIKLTQVAGAYWRGDERNPMLQRIYGTAFAHGSLGRVPQTARARQSPGPSQARQGTRPLHVRRGRPGHAVFLAAGRVRLQSNGRVPASALLAIWLRGSHHATCV